jgi:hypothetical protein
VSCPHPIHIGPGLRKRLSNRVACHLKPSARRTRQIDLSASTCGPLSRSCHDPLPPGWVGRIRVRDARP